MISNTRIMTGGPPEGVLTPHAVSMVGHHLSTRQPEMSHIGFAGQPKLSEPSQSGHDDGPLSHVIHDVITPILLAYVGWVLDHAKQNGIGRLYFVARDGEILYRVAQTLVGHREAIELRYLYGSRRAWLLPSISRGNADWQRLAVTPGHVNSPHDIVERIGLDNQTREAIRTLLSYEIEQWQAPLPYKQAQAFLTKLMRNDVAVNLMMSSAAPKRAICLSYFAQEGMLDDISWALVDAGWSLNSQGALKRILDLCGSCIVTKGYYLALDRNHLGEPQAGSAYPFISQTDSVFSRRRIVIEHCFLPSTHATTKGYRLEGNRVLPVFGPELRSPAELAYARRLHDAAIAAAKVIAADRTALTVHTNEIVSNAVRFLRRPTVAEARAMSIFGTTIDMRQESSLKQPLCHALVLKDLCSIFAISVCRKALLKARPFGWLEGSIMLSPIYIRVPLWVLLYISSLRDRLNGRN